MDFVRNDAGDLFTIEMVRGMASPPALWCVGELPGGDECSAKVQIKALHSQVMSAHFAAAHGPGCDNRSEHTEDRPGDAGYTAEQGLRPVRWRMRLPDDDASSGPDGRRRPNDLVPGEKTRRKRADASRGLENIAEDRSFSTLLLNILADKIPPSLELVIGTLAPQMASDLIVAAADADSATYVNRTIILWGEVKLVRPTPYDGLMLKLRYAADDVAVLVDEANMKRLRIPSASAIEGKRHVIAFGKYVIPESSGRPHLRVVKGALAFNPRVRLPRQ